MVNAVKSRPNHYEVLGLKPNAGEADVADAFARQMRLPHPVSELAQIGVAFDTLRSPTKRRSYDEAIGLRSEPPVSAVPTAMSFRISARLAALAAPGPIEPSADLQGGRPRPVPDDTRREPLREQRSLPKAAARRPDPELAALDRPPVGPRIERSNLRPPVAARAVRSRPGIDEILEIHGPLGEEQGSGLGTNAAALGGLLLAVVLIGAWAGAHAQDSDGSKPSADIHRAHRVKAAEPSGASANGTGAQLQAPAAPATHSRRADAPLPSPRSRVARVRLSDRAPLAAPPAQDISSEQASDVAGPQAPDGSASAASLPLPAGVIARTLERIGYGCGDVVSATAVGSDGVYKISCSSGDAYQAKPVRGRYHFRRW